MSVEAALLCAVDPLGLGGVALRSAAGPQRDAWLAGFRTLMNGAPWRRIPPDLPDNRLLGGLDLTATLALGRPVAESGVLAAVDGGTLVIAMAERMPGGTAARIGAVMDARAVVIEREGVAFNADSRFCTLLLDEGIEADERAPAALLDRLAFHIMPGEVPPDLDLSDARALLPRVTIADEFLQALTGAALALGIASPRAVLLALNAARAAAALDGRDAVEKADAELAARLVLAPRATQAPPPPETDEDEAEPPPPPPEQNQEEPPPPDENAPMAEPRELEELLLAAAAANLPPELLDQAKLAALSGRGGGRAGEARSQAKRGRPIGSRVGEPRGDARMAVLDTLRAAAPWQAIRAKPDHARIAIRREDFRIKRYKQKNEVTSIFAVDASGSSAMNRLAEAKGAVELLLAECYVRRDRVALIAFRGKQAEVLLPPTQALARAKRSLAGLPGGGPTPLASGIDTARELALGERRAGRSPLVVLMTDGRGNIARDGAPGHARAQADALDAARTLRAAGISCILLDTAPRPQPAARALAEAAAAVYLPMPMADSARMARAAGAAAQRLVP
jgi:magnesium chelatase subunit D